jgi:hypothetical protein
MKGVPNSALLHNRGMAALGGGEYTQLTSGLSHNTGDSNEAEAAKLKLFKERRISERSWLGYSGTLRIGMPSIFSR